MERGKLREYRSRLSEALSERLRDVAATHTATLGAITAELADTEEKLRTEYLRRHVLEWAARHLGESTDYSQQIREGKAPNEGRDFSYSEQRQKLMTAEQITGMKADDLLLLGGVRNPLKAKQNVYFKSKTYRGMVDQNPLN